MPPTGDFLSVDIDDHVTKSLQLVPNAIRKEIAKDLPPKLLEIVKQEPPYSGGVTRKQAYGVSFFTDRQRRWFFAALRRGEIDIPYNRTHETAKSWQIVSSGGNTILENTSPNAWRVYGDQQPRILGIIGWKKLSDIMRANKPKISQVIGKAVKMALSRIFRR